MGTEDSQVYKGGTIFYDTASIKIRMHHKFSFTAELTIMSNLKFEREAMDSGVPVESYYTDNGIYTSKEFIIELHDKDQGIGNNEVGGHHHNGIT